MVAAYILKFRVRAWLRQTTVVDSQRSPTPIMPILPTRRGWVWARDQIRLSIAGYSPSHILYMHMSNPALEKAAMGISQSRARESYNLGPGSMRRESKDQPTHVKRTEAKNLMFGVLELARYPLALKRTPRDAVPCVSEYCEQLLEVR